MNRLKTVLQVTDFGAPYAGNFVACLRALQRPLGAAGLRQVVLLPPRARQRPWAAQMNKAGEISVHFLPEGNQLTVARAVAKLARRENAVLMHSHFSPADNISFLAKLLLGCHLWNRHRCSLVWHYHANPQRGGDWIRRLLGPPKYRWAARLGYHIAVSEGVLKSMLARGVPRSRCRTVLNAIDVARASSPQQPRQEVREQLGLRNRRVFLLFGRDPYIKGLDIAVNAFELAARKYPDVSLLVIGQQQTREYVQAKYGVAPPSWLVLADFRECPADYFAASDFFVSASRTEGLPYSVLEALANRRLVVASDIPGLEWARRVPSILLFGAGDAQALSGRVAEMLSLSDADHRALVEAGFDYLVAEHSAEHWADRIVDLYGEIIN